MKRINDPRIIKLAQRAGFPKIESPYLYELTEWLHENYNLIVTPLPVKKNSVTKPQFIIMVIKDSYDDFIIYENGTHMTWYDAMIKGINEALLYIKYLK